MSLLSARTPVAKLLSDPAISQTLQQQLEKSQNILAFAAKNGLPVESSYGSYVDLDRQFVVWNVFAAPRDSVSLIQHCFPIAGCVGYKGYFAEADAQAFAAELKASGFDVFVGGVAAYSTLGWFNDPLLNTFIFRDDARLAAVLFHELAHKVLYLEGDTVFNESFATAVERHLLRAWLASRDQDSFYDAYVASEARRATVIGLILETRKKLDVLFQSDLTAEQKRKMKGELLAELKSQYRALQSRWSAGTEFSVWIEQDLNNAHLAAIGAYQSQVPGFTRLLQASPNLEEFFTLARDLAEQPKTDRDRALAQHHNAN
jgi:predicted aminopeptidase